MSIFTKLRLFPLLLILIPIPKLILILILIIQEHFISCGATRRIEMGKAIEFCILTLRKLRGLTQTRGGVGVEAETGTRMRRKETISGCSGRRSTAF